MPRTGPYSFTIQWSINQIYCNPFKRGKSLTSPEFQVNALGGTRWRLQLYPRGTTDPNYMALMLNRSADEGSGLSSVTVDFRVSMDNVSRHLSFTKSAEGIAFRRNRSWGFSRFVKVSWAKILSNTSITQTFTIRCEMSLSDEVDVAEDSTIDLRTLCEDFGKIRGMSEHSDVTLKCGREEFAAHKVVISARAPKLAQALNLQGDVVDASFMSSHVLKTLLFYLYTGNVDVSVFNIPKELMRIAEQFDLRGLLKLMHVIPNVCHAMTTLKVEHKSFLWSLMERKEATNVRMVSTSGLDISCLLMSLQVTDERITVGIRPRGMVPDGGVFVKCAVIGGENNCVFWELSSREHLFEYEEEWTQEVLFQESHMPDFNSLGIEIDVCDGIAHNWLKQESSTLYSNPGLFEFGLLSCDLQPLIYNPSFSDVVITCDDHVFPAHRVVLAARSPVFEKMFEHDFLEKLTRTVKVTDFRPKVVRALLFYIYCGKLSSLEYDDIRDLYEAADKYQIIVLRKKCSAVLLEHLTFEDAGELWWIADMHSDEDLMKLVDEFVDSYSSVLETSV